MARSLGIEFRPVQEPITEPVTKFAGQPVWLDTPQWPTSRTTGLPMQFIGQIELRRELFGDLPSRMAYLFMTDDDDVDGTFEPDGGENAILLQPGPVTVPVVPLAEGPTLQTFMEVSMPRSGVAQEYAVDLIPREEPDFTDQDTQWADWEPAAREAYWEAVQGNKVGGTPGFMQGDEFPGPGEWRLLLQLDAGRVPFEVNFGDAGIGYGFLSADGRTAKFLWQCS